MMQTLLFPIPVKKKQLVEIQELKELYIERDLTKKFTQFPILPL